MESKDEEVAGNSVSAKKRIRLEALEQRLTSEDSGNLGAYLSSPAEHQGKEKKKIRTKGRLPRTYATGRSPLASGTLARSSELEDSEANDPVYFQLSESVHENLIGSHLQNSNVEVGGNAINGILHDLLKSSYSRGKHMKDSVSTKFLFLDSHVVQGDAFARARMRALHSKGKRSNKHMSKRQHRQCGSFNLPRKYQNYNVYVPMHEFWKEYIRSLFRVSRQNNIEQCLLTADFHGAIFAVLDSKNKSFTGVQGIMIRETKNTFGILTSENKFRVVPKKGSIFMFQVDFYRVILYGEKLASQNLNQVI